MLPLRDDNPVLHVPLGTYALLGLNVLSWVLVQGMGSQLPLAESICTLGMVPGVLLGQAVPGTQIPVAENLTCVLDGGRALTQPLMYDQELGDYKFTLVRYAQQKNGIQVFRCDLRLLMRNRADFPVILAASSLRPTSTRPSAS